MFTWFAKATVAVVVPAIIAGVTAAVEQTGVDTKWTINTAITSFVTGFFVYMVPNVKR